MLMARMVTTARVQKGSQVQLALFKSAFTLSDQKNLSSWPTKSISISLLCSNIYNTLRVDMNVTHGCSLGPPNLSGSLKCKRDFRRIYYVLDLQ